MNASRKNCVKLGIENLEDRRVPTTAVCNNGVLWVRGSDASETIRVTQYGTGIYVEGAGSFSTSNVRGLVVDAYGGNDYVDLRTLRVGATVWGGTGNDFIVGGMAGDYLAGGEGDDRIFGLDGNDGLHGDGGHDLLFGMNGYDFLYGGSGSDFLDDGNRIGQEYADGGAGYDWNADVVAVNGTAYTDVYQGGAPTCGFLSSLSALAARGYNFTRWISYAGFDSGGTPLYDVSFWNGSSWTKTRISFDGALTGTDTGYAAEGESWVIIMQRAWIQYHGNGGRTWPHEAIFHLSGRQSDTRYSIVDADYGRIAAALNQGKVVTCSTVSNPNGVLIGTHAYSVMRTTAYNSDYWVQVRNPWGKDGGAASDSNYNDGLIWLRWRDFKANMTYLGIA